MNNLSEWEKRYLEDVDVCIRLLETLKENYTSPVTSLGINTRKVSRVRITINDLLKKH